MIDHQWLGRISAADVNATEQTRLVVQTSAFKLLLSLQDNTLWINWATPLKPDPNELEIAAMIEAFREHGRTPRLEFMGEVWSGLAARLEAAGFVSEGEPQDIMIVTGETFKPFRASRVQIQFLAPSDSDAALASYFETQSKGFGYGDDHTPTPEKVSNWRNQIHAGRRAVLGSLEGQLVAAGSTQGTELAEVQGVTTLPEARRHGVAATVSSALVADVFERGGRAVWLSVEEDAARACYAKIGFRTIGSRLNYSLNT
jgi:ribosomal protein S18 acetylase RimI-like enzyme